MGAALFTRISGNCAIEPPLIRLDASQSLIGCQLQLFKLTLVEIADPGLQRRLRNGSHLECQRDGVLGRQTG